jgi:oligoribonuclease (3'-5' exoribonuclease)
MISRRKQFLEIQVARKKAKEDAAATMIQSIWRSFVCYKEFSYSIIDVVIVQSVARRWVAKQLAQRLRTEHYAAITIQSKVRGRIVYLRYMLSLLHIVTAQAMARRWMARELFSFLKKEKHERQILSATKIAASWRGLVIRREYIILVGGMSFVFIKLIIE